jgi:UDP:flavonoid glycosyltransferase YjiC (YdhE family)
LKREGKIYFSACGLGLGHVSRCLGVFRELVSRGKFEAFFSSYLDALPLLEAEGLRFTGAPAFSYWTWPDGAVDPWRTLKWLSGRLFFRFMKQVDFEIKQLAAFKPDLVVSDSRLSTVIASKLLGRPILTILNQLRVIAPGLIHYPKLFRISDFFSHGFIEPGWGLSDKIVIPDFPPPYTVSGENLKAPPALKRKIRYVGPLLPVRPESFPSQEELKAELGFSPQEPLVYAAVSGPAYERWWLGVRLLKAFSNPPGNFQVALSLGRRLEDFRQEKDKIKVYSWLPNRFKMLKACDLVVSRSGHGTITQALAYGKPMVLIPTQEQTEQIFNAKTAMGLGVAKALDPRYLSRETLQPLISEILQCEEYGRKAEKIMAEAKRLPGFEGIVGEILSLL